MNYPNLNNNPNNYQNNRYTNNYQPVQQNSFPNSYNQNGNYGAPYNNQSNGINAIQNIGMMGQRGRQNYSNPNYQSPNAHLDQGQLYNKDLDGSLQGSARNGFIRKVYTLLSLQLLVTVVIGYIAFNNPTFKSIFVNTPMIIVLSVLLMALSCVIGCCTDTFRKYALPIFIVFTLLFALLVAISICGFKSKIVLMAAGLTLILVVALTAFACFTKTDLTGCGPYLMVFCLILLVFGIVAIFWRDPIVHLIYSCLSALLFSIYLIFDTQLVLGRGQYSYSLDDAYLAAIQLYIDIIQLFLQLLQILSYFDN